MTDTDDGSINKVARLIDSYDLDGLGEELEARWTGERGERTGLRDLADTFNKRLLEQALLETGSPALERDIERIYRDLTDESVSSGIRTDTYNELRSHGIDPDALKDDFVSYQSIRRYLTEGRGVKYTPPSDQEKLENDLEAIQRIVTRANSVTEERLERQRDLDRLAIDDFEVILDAKILCRNCGSLYIVGELFEQGGCPCLQDQSDDATSR